MLEKVAKNNLDCSELSQAVLTDIEQRLGTPVFNLWFKNTHFVTLTREQAVLGVQNRFIKGWIERKYLADILDSIKATANIKPDIAVSIDSELFQAGREKQAEDQSQPVQAVANPADVTRNFAKVNNKYKLDNFIAIKDNALPLLITRQFINSLDNPLYQRLTFLGSRGNGKTHLLKGIELSLMKEHPQHRSCYMTGEAFANAYISAMQRKQYNEFNDRFNQVDVLLIDDVQFLASKKKTQEMLVLALKNFESAGKCVVMASDTHPTEIPGLLPELSDLLVSGMMVDSPMPCQEGRELILQSMCHKSNALVPNNVIHFLATTLTNSVRELEGGLLKVIAYAGLKGIPASIELARNILGPRVHQSTQVSLSLKDLIDQVAASLQVNAEEITSRKQNRQVARSRQIAMYIVRQISVRPYKEIGEYFGGKKYSAVMYAEKNVEKMMIEDPSLKDCVTQIIERLGKK